MQNIKIFKTKVEVEQLIIEFKKEFKFKSFPYKIIKDETSFSYYFNVANTLFPAHIYPKFISLIKSLKEESIFFLTATVQENDWKEYEKRFVLNQKTKISWSPAIEVALHDPMDYESFDKIIQYDYGYGYEESYIFGSSLNWIAHFVPNRDFMILYFKNSLEFKKSKLYENYRIETLEQLIEGSPDGFNNNEIKELKENWIIG